MVALVLQLVEELDSDFTPERPFQDVVMLTLHHVDADGDVSTLPFTVALWSNLYTHPVASSTSEK